MAEHSCAVVHCPGLVTSYTWWICILRSFLSETRHLEKELDLICRNSLYGLEQGILIRDLNPDHLAPESTVVITTVYIVLTANT